MKLLFATALSGLLLGVVTAGASTITVQSTDDIYNAGTSTPPVGIALNGATYLTFTNVTGSLLSSSGNPCLSAEGCIVLHDSTDVPPNDADGNHAAVSSSSNTGAGSISGVTLSGAGSLVGVFIPTGGPTGAAPAALNFLTLGSSFTSLSPLLDQVFFIGDGLTGDGSGSVQVFNVPTGAGTLFLGISDACGFNGSPGCYSDNLGFYTAQVNASPEPASLLLLGAGLAVIGLSSAKRCGK